MGARNLNNSIKVIEEFGSNNCIPIIIDLNSEESINDLDKKLEMDYPEGIDVINFEKFHFL
jgi:hypothetical protein